MRDTLKYVKMLEEKGFRTEDAQAHVGLVRDMVYEEFALKNDLDEFRNEVSMEFADFRKEVAKEFADFRKEVAKEFSDFRNEVDQEFRLLRSEMDYRFQLVDKEFALVRLEMKKGFSQQYNRLMLGMAGLFSLFFALDKFLKL